ncbi:fibrinogen-like YCDxxxxGGGW domain-containing protein [Nocardioides sp. CCNWLW239]|uniref:fibrinogen-like YCDxxxxGGGW domain-containing protein n=1 Tax=Nocardioides sp. CCNWLW239 TaxID=3128902 RepID=UPI00301B69AD
MSKLHHHRAGRAAAVTLAVTFGVLTPGYVAPVSPASAAEAPLGTESNPAGSCWEIKQVRPDAPSGVYWLWTPELVVADRFYCDQVTSGGGWVLVGRGREGWSTAATGRGTSAEVRSDIAGVGGFSPRQLPVTTVNALLGDLRVDDTWVRLRRATDAAGTRWQEAQFQFGGEGQPGWTWQFESAMPVTNVQFNGTPTAGGTGARFGSETNLAFDVNTTTDVKSGWSVGWGITDPTNVLGGSTSGTSYLYKKGTQVTKPFTQVYLRPARFSSDFGQLPAEGTPAATRPAVARSESRWNPWGVSGLGPSYGGYYDVEVQAFAEGDGVMYVGGNFTTVQRDARGTDAVEQPYLAAFDVSTGEWVSAFRPALDDQVRSLEVLPDGRLVVGGDFTTVNGEGRQGFAVLDPSTGDLDQFATTTLTNRVGSLRPSVWAAEVKDGYLYIGGKFTHASSARATGEVYSRNLMRLSVDDLSPDRTFWLNLNGTVYDLDVSDDGDRLYAAGRFTANGTADAVSALAMDIPTTTQIPWTISKSHDAYHLQGAVLAVGDNVWLTGAEHLVAVYDAGTMQVRQTWLTHNGGDGQALASDGRTVYAGCHCSENVYEGASRMLEWTRGTSNHGAIDQLGAYDSTGATLETAFAPRFGIREGSGVWATLIDSDGTMWVGGDLTHASRDTITKRWTGGFARFAPADAAAPVAPSGLKVVSDGTTDSLSWTGSPERGVTYQVLRNDRPVATTAASTHTVPAVDGAAYAVRAIDAAGNASASTAMVTP